MSDSKDVKAVKDKDLTGREAGKNKEKSDWEIDQEIQEIIEQVTDEVKKERITEDKKKEEMTQSVAVAEETEGGCNNNVDTGSNEKTVVVCNNNVDTSPISKENYPGPSWHLKCLDMMTDPDETYTQRQIARACGISEKTVSVTINHNKEFKKLYASMVSDVMIDSKPRVDRALTKKAQSGDTSAIRLYYERIENMQNRFRTDLTIDVDVF